MHQHFHAKSLAFYGAMTAAVFLLFQAVTAYGEKQLKAPVSLGGDYTIELENPPQCLKNRDLVLKIEQSGIYVFANLGLKNAEHNRDKIQLQGNLKDHKMNISGTLNPFFVCANDSLNSLNILTLEGIFKEKEITGKLDTPTLSNPINFKAELNLVSPSKKQAH
ncbi:hypothetical protein PCC9214_02342 [Planktothrix tepida]|uniref:Uncharacterized protein n=2 Tax=Planktothrix TaxID=54304 RepID=A0A1J1LIH2_9CYAN|nr:MULTISPECIES: hypothetical protein [Planktothrix]CAD5947595.1 hypothetical protein PCC9214_02342 [Planktothrix tepida]CAD5963340.1 hypothetical protein NO713_03343 [Planktothrix pseudagardhii]CUR32397.1 conserved exported hypothetical protein [Planktothrix tepida PCC 9214]